LSGPCLATNAEETVMAAVLPPLFQLLSARASFLQARHAVLTQNVANADTPRYRPRDLVEPDFASTLQKRPAAVPPVTVARTRADHLAGLAMTPAPARTTHIDGFEVAPSGNEVLIEEQLRLMGGAARGYQLATSVYAKYVGLMRTALGAGA
jgi:flagellar basal-body rod protein FlgB